MQNDTQIRRQLKDVLELARERLFFERDRTGPGAKFRQELDRGQIERGVPDPFAVHDHYVELVKELNSHGDFSGCRWSGSWLTSNIWRCAR